MVKMLCTFTKLLPASYGDLARRTAGEGRIYAQGHIFGGFHRPAGTREAGRAKLAWSLACSTPRPRVRFAHSCHGLLAREACLLEEDRDRRVAGDELRRDPITVPRAQRPAREQLGVSAREDPCGEHLAFSCPRVAAHDLRRGPAPVLEELAQPRARSRPEEEVGSPVVETGDRKSTRLNSSHLGISYA